MIRNLKLLTSAVALATTAGMTVAQVARPPRHTPGHAAATTAATTAAATARTVTVTGIVDGYELDPHGTVNAIVLKDGDRIDQLNVPPEVAGMLVAAAPVGQREQAVGTPLVVVGNRALFKLVSLTGPDGKAVAVPDGSGPHAVHVEGTVRTLNFGQKGELNGAVLDTGDFVHTGSAAAAAVGLTVGLKLDIDGTGTPMATGHSAIEAAKVNGVTTDRPAAAEPTASRLTAPGRGWNVNPPMNRDDADRDGRPGPRPRADRRALDGPLDRPASGRGHHADDDDEPDRHGDRHDDGGPGGRPPGR